MLESTYLVTQHHVTEDLSHQQHRCEKLKSHILCRYGRVNYVLAKRLDLLMEVQRLQDSLDVAGDVAYTCETAGHFFLYQILARWERFLSRVRPATGKVCDVLSSKYCRNWTSQSFSVLTELYSMKFACICYMHVCICVRTPTHLHG